MLRSPNSTFAVVVVVVDTADSYPRASREAPVIQALRKCVVKLLKRCEFERKQYVRRPSRWRCVPPRDDLFCVDLLVLLLSVFLCLSNGNETCHVFLSSYDTAHESFSGAPRDENRTDLSK